MAEQPSLLDMLPEIVPLMTSTPARPHAMLIDPERGHVAIELESLSGSNRGQTSAFVLADLGSSLRLSAWPVSADVTPEQARELAAHLTSWADGREGHVLAPGDAIDRTAVEALLNDLAKSTDQQFTRTLMILRLRAMLGLGSPS